MTLLATAATTYDLKGIREELDDVVYRITPEQTPLLSMIGTTPVNNTLYEWQTDVLATAITTNAQLEGDVIATVSAITATVRVGNYTQISRKTFAVTGTDDAVRLAGRKSEAALQTSKKGAELKLDIETTIFANVGGAAGSTTVARTTATLGGWLKTNCDIGTGAAANPVYTSGVPAVGRTDGTQRAYTETIHKSVLSKMYTAGATQKFMFLGPVNKGLFSAFAGVATKTFELSTLEQTAIIAAADVYVGDFGKIQALPSRNIRTRDVYYIDPEYISRAVLRPMNRTKLPIALDGEAYMILTEWGLKVANEAAHGSAVDLS